MEPIQTLVKFIAKGAEQPEFISGATGDAISIIVIALIAFCATIAIAIFALSKKACAEGGIATVLASKKTKALIAVLAVGAAVLLACTLVTNVARAGNAPNAIASASDVINATVDEETGEITFDQGWIKSTSAEKVVFEAVTLDYIEGIKLTEECSWQVKIDNEIIYEGEAGQKITTAKSYEFFDSSLSFKVENMSIQTAKSLIDKNVLTLGFYIFTQKQDASIKIVEEEFKNFVDLILDESKYPTTELLTEDKEALLDKIEKAKEISQEKIVATTDPEELQKIVDEFNATVEELTNQANEQKSQTIEEKSNFITEQTNKINADIQTITDDPWIQDDRKDYYNGLLNNTKFGTLSKVGLSTSHEDLNAAMEQTKNEIAATEKDYQAESEITEKQIKTDAENWAKNQVEIDVKIIQEMPNLWDEDKTTFSQDIKNANKTLLDDIEKAQSKEDVETAKQDYNKAVEEVNKNAKDEADKAAAEKKEAIDTLNAEKNNLDTALEKAAEKNSLYTDNYETLKKELETISVGIQGLDKLTSKDEFNKQKQEITNSLGLEKTTIENQIKTDEDSKAALNQELDNKNTSAKKALQDLGTKMSDETRQLYFNKITPLINNQKYDIQTAKNEKEAQDGNKKVLAEVDKIIKEAQAQVAEWIVVWNPATSIDIEYDGSAILDAAELDDDRYDSTMGDLGPTYTIDPAVSGFSIERVEADNTAKITISGVEGGKSYPINVKASFRGVTDAGCATVITKDITVNVGNKSAAKAVVYTTGDSTQADSEDSLMEFVYDNKTYTPGTTVVAGKGTVKAVYNVIYTSSEKKIYPEWIDATTSPNNPVSKVNPLHINIDTSFKLFTNYDEHSGEMAGKPFTSLDYFFAYMNQNKVETSNNNDETSWITGLENIVEDKIISTNHFMEESFTGDETYENSYYVDFTNFKQSNITSCSYMFQLSQINQLKIPGNFIPNITDLGETPSPFRTYKGKIIDFIPVTVDSKVVKFGHNIINAEYLFQGCSALTSLDAEDLDFSSVTSLKYCFQSCQALESINLSTSKNNIISDYCGAFQSCFMLKEIDISGFSTKNISSINLKSMFRLDGVLEKVYVSEDWDLTCVESALNEMTFWDCDKLVGGDGTKFDETKTDGSMAKIDSAGYYDNEDVAGYFTYVGDDACKLTYDLNLPSDSNAGNDDYKNYFQQVPQGDYFTVQGATELPLPVWPESTNAETKYFAGWTIKNSADKTPYFAGTKLKAQGTDMVLEANWNATPLTGKAVYKDSDKSLTFYYDNDLHSDATEIYPIYYTSSKEEVLPEWHNDTLTNDCTNVVFDKSFAGFRNYPSTDPIKANEPFTSMDCWFKDLQFVSRITGFENIKGQIKSINEMFESFGIYLESKEKILDLSGFPSRYLEQMESTFESCSFGTIIIPDGFAQSLGDTYFYDNQGVFYKALFDYIIFNGKAFESLTDFSFMFWQAKCKSVDFSNFQDTTKITKTEKMFSMCHELQIIYVNKVWDLSKVTISADMFRGCKVLTGQKGTTIDGVMNVLHKEQDVATSGTYAVVDQGLNSAQPGYLTLGPAGEKKGKAVCYQETDSNGDLVDSLMEFVYDDHNYATGQYIYGKGTVKNWYPVTYTDSETPPKWLSETTGEPEFNPKHINFDTSFIGFTKYDADSPGKKDQTFTSLDGFFAGMTALKSDVGPSCVTGFENIAPTIESANGMFYASGGNDASVDFSNFDQSNLAECSQMFFDCSLTKLTIPANFAPKVTNFQTLGSPFNHAYYKEINFVTKEVEGLTIKYGHNITNAYKMFSECSNLETINFDDLDLSNCTSFEGMFGSCGKLQNIDLSSWQYDKATNMTYMFHNCLKVKTIDLSSFDTSSVKYMKGMFYSCGQLKTVYVGEKWKTDLVKGVEGDYGQEMFKGCDNLIGEEDTTLEKVKEIDQNNYISVKYAVVDEGIDSASPGYLSSHKTAKAVHDKANHTFKFYYDAKSYEGENIEVYPITWTHMGEDPTQSTPPLWIGNQSVSKVADVTNVEITKSFAKFKKYDLGDPDHEGQNFSSIDGWFMNMPNFIDIKGLEYVMDKVTSANMTFYSCSKLETINYDIDWSDSLEGTFDMFMNCQKLKGGNGTKYNWAKTDGVMAKIDSAGYYDNEDKYGYLTYNGDDACKLTYDLNGGIATDDVYENYFQQVPQGDYFTVQGAEAIPNPEWPEAGNGDKKYFAGWRVKASNDSAPYFAGSKLKAQNSQITLIATWSDTPLTGKAVYNDNDKSFTFYYDALSHESDQTEVYPIIHTTYIDGEYDILPAWCDEVEEIVKVAKVTNIAFDKSFAGFTKYDYQADPKFEQPFTSMDFWFQGFVNVNSISGFENIKGHIASINATFVGLGQTAEPRGHELNLSGFQTKYIIEELKKAPFGGCSFERMIIPDGFAPLYQDDNPEGPSFFYGINVDHIVFEGKAFESLTNFKNMFSLATCSTIDFSNFQSTSNIEFATRMFSTCENLTTIYVNESWDLTNVIESDDMFTGCIKLTGQNGTNFSNIKERSGIESDDDTRLTDKTFAKVDQYEGSGVHPEQCGYLTLKLGEKKAKAVYDSTDKTFTFYYDNDPHTSENTIVYPVTYTKADDANPVYPYWSNDFQKMRSVKSVIFDKSFAGFKNYDYQDDPMLGKPFTSMDYWFYDFRKVTNITGFENIKGNIETINCTFAGAGPFETEGTGILDLSSFPSNGIKDLSGLTFYQSKFKKIIIPDGFCCNCINQFNSEYERGLFAELICDTIEFKGSAFDSLSDYSSMFKSADIKTIDFSNFQNSAKILKATDMFNASTVEKIYVGSNWNLENLTAENSTNMFDDCGNLEGQNGTTIANAAQEPRKEYTDQEHLLDAYMAKIDMWNEQEPAEDTAGYLSLGPDPSQKRAKAICYNDGVDDTLMEFVYDDVEYQEGAWDSDKNAFIKYVFPVTYTHFDTEAGENFIFPKWFYMPDDENTVSPDPLVNPLHIKFAESFYDFTTYADDDPTEEMRGKPFCSLDLFFPQMLQGEWSFNNSPSNWIEGFENIHENIITSTRAMFEESFLDSLNNYCIDLTDFKQSNLKDTEFMFMACYVDNLIIPPTFIEKATSLRKSGEIVDETLSPFFESGSQFIEFKVEHTPSGDIKFGHNLQDPYGLFGYSRISDIDLDTIDLSNATNTDEMFAYCENLHRIYSSTDFNTSKIISSKDMFSGCESLIGGNGTTYYPSDVDVTMAKIDRAAEDSVDDVAGYFTYKGTDACKITYDLKIPESLNDGGNEEYDGYFQQIKQGQYFTVQGATALPAPQWPSSITPKKYFEGWKISGEGTTYFSSTHVLVPDTSEIKLEAQWVDDPLTGKAVYKEEDKSFTFYYDNDPHSDATNIFRIFYNGNSEEAQIETTWDSWVGKSNVQSIEFDQSFAGFTTYPEDDPTVEMQGAPFTSMEGWFKEFDQVNNITGFENIKGPINNISFLFDELGLNANPRGEEIDLTGFPSNDIYWYEYAFKGCNFDNIIVPDGFAPNLSVRTEADGAPFFSSAKADQIIFKGKAFESLNDFSTWFENAECSIIDFSNFQSTLNITNTWHMFNGCVNLTTIYVNESWDLSNLSQAYDMFGECTKLVGGNGTRFDPEITTAWMACIDYATQYEYFVSRGYLTYKGNDACKLSYDLNGITITDSPYNTLTQSVKAGQYFTVQGDYFENPVDPAGAKAFDGWKIQGKEDQGTYHGRQQIPATVEPIVLVAQWSDPKVCAKAVYESSDQSFTFYYDLDLHTDATRVYKVTYTYFSPLEIFSVYPEWYRDADIEAVQSVVFDESFVGFTNYAENDPYMPSQPFTSMDHWFCGFSNVKNFIGFENIKGNIKTINSLFHSAGNYNDPGILDLSSFPSNGIENVLNPFSYCNFKKIIIPDGFCPNLISQGDIYNKIGFFSSSVVDAIEFKGTAFNSLTDYSYMFNKSSVKIIDLSNFLNSSKIAKANGMFKECGNLNKIYVNNSWNLENLTPENSVDMFYGCRSLSGENGTTIASVTEGGQRASYVEKQDWILTSYMAHIDAWDQASPQMGQPGYLSSPPQFFPLYDSL